MNNELEELKTAQRVFQKFIDIPMNFNYDPFDFPTWLESEIKKKKMMVETILYLIEDIVYWVTDKLDLLGTPMVGKN